MADPLTRNPNKLGAISYDQGFLDVVPAMAKAHNYEYSGALPITKSTTIDDAVAFVKDSSPSLLFLEVNWNQSPSDNKGLDALVQINRLESPPSVYMTSGDELWREESIRKGAAGYISLADVHSDQFFEALEAHEKSIQRKPYALVVDDQESVREYVTAFFKRAGFEVVTANDGLQAKKIYETNLAGGRQFDLVLTDIMMSRDQSANGDVILETVKTLTPNVPIYAWTGYDTRPDYEPTLARVKSLCPTGILDKPDGISKLATIIKNLGKQKESN